MFFVFAVVVCFHSSKVKALSCYQGQAKTENGIEGVQLLPCVNIANSCVRQDDPQTRITHLGCMAENCTDEQGQYSSEPICKKMSQSPYLLTCCCYGDGCNRNLNESMYKVVQEEQMPELKCYQGITSMDQPVNSTGGAELLPCFHNANSCAKLIDINSRVVQRGCSTESCTDDEGHYSSVPVCVTMLKGQPHFEKCCCNGDGCNGDQEPIPINGLKCYQRQTMMDQPVNSTGGSPLLPCQQKANTCVKQVDFNSGVVQRGCTLAFRNCTDEQGQYSYTQVCKNMTHAPYLGECCCHGDGCNI